MIYIKIFLLCQKGCKYNGINYTYFAANCICNSSFLENNFDKNNITTEENDKDEKLNFSVLKESFITNLFDFNINVIYCYNLVFNLKLLKNNIGFFCMRKKIYIKIT